jgi:DNA-binding transcriptional MerR regulator
MSIEQTPGVRGFRIGTVARLTGLHPHTIRAWERRHDAVRPTRSEGGTRLYGEDDVARLQLIKALQERGDSLSPIAALGREELEARLCQLVQAAPDRLGRGEEEAPRLAVLDRVVAEQIRANARGLGPLVVVGLETRRDAFLRVVRTRAPDLLVLGDERLGEEPLALLEELERTAPDALFVIVYEFASRQRLERLARRGSRLVRGPLSLSMLCRVLLELWTLRGASLPRRRSLPPAPPQGPELPDRLFDDTQLARLREISTGIACECPNQLSSIVSSLVAFERYCRDCESRDAEDAHLHRQLGDGTAEARLTMERLLVRLCEHDGIRP